MCLFREELRGISRGKNAKDVNWSEVAATFDDVEPVSLMSHVMIVNEKIKINWNFQVAEKPSPIKISVDEILQKVRKPSKNKIKAGLATVDKNSQYLKC